VTGLACVQLSSSQIPRWLDRYIASIGDNPNLFDFVELNTALTSHIRSDHLCTCISIPGHWQTIRNFWEALMSVIDGCFDKVSTIDVYEVRTWLKSL